MPDWESIRETYAPMVWGTVARILKHREDSLDCCQDVFAEAVERERKGPVDNWGPFLRWLATRRAIDYLRRRERDALKTGSADDVRDVAPSAESVAEFGELVSIVRHELASLPERQATAFWLVCVEERCYEEVAQQMGVDRNAVGVLVHRARRHVRSRLSALKPVRQDSVAPRSNE